MISTKIEFGNSIEKVEFEDMNEIYNYVYEIYTEEIERAFMETVEECEVKPFTIFGYQYNEAVALKEVDPIAYWQEVLFWYDVLMSDVYYELRRGNETSIGYITIKIIEDEEE